ncbi:hypothetical protein LBMAG42_45480 [Deltaproteobacteria bacterium]|nr:hypothetical protein LBMAG42_45480 [Deltaproteobacteria bacterium]
MPRRPLTLLPLLALTGCLSRYLDAPYVLTTGLAGATQIDWGPEPGTFIVSTKTGPKLVDQTGAIVDSPTSKPTKEPLHPGALTSIVTDEGVLWADAAGALRLDETVILTGLVRPRGLTCDRLHRNYIVSGEAEPALYRVDGDHLTLIANWVGPVVDVAWGSGGWLATNALYLLREDGVLEYLQPPGVPVAP